MLKCVIKRDGAEAPFDGDRVERAIQAAMTSVGRTDYEDTRVVKLQVLCKLAPIPHTLKVEEIQDQIERSLMEHGEYDAAKAFILYRNEKNEGRPTEYGESGISDYITMAKYSRYRPELGRREVWSEASGRVFDMHRDFFSTKLKKKVPEFGLTVGQLIDRAQASVTAKDTLPSMRSMQFGGQAILETNARVFNCSAGYIDHPRKFAEAMWLLLCGCGVGFSVQTHHVAKLPAFPVRGNEDDLLVVHHQIADTIAGWADALDALIQSHYNGTYIEFDYSAIRAKGAPLKTSGGRAPGHLPLKKSLVKVRELLNGVSGRHMKPIEAYDILMHSAGAVISGGIRRSATIALFSVDDEDMISAKTGEWWKYQPQRQHSNNSAVLVRSRATRDEFDNLFNAIKQYGEPGFYFSSDDNYLSNPCVEIGLYPTLQVDAIALAKLRKYGYKEPVQVGDELTGWAMCNLSTINGGHATSPEEFYRLCVDASITGTLQAAYTDAGYLGPVTRVILEREALIGVGICGVLENPQVMLDPEVLRTGAELVKSTNNALAKVLGIEPAARTTCVKPDGSSSLVLETGSGIHPRHAHRYFRRVQAARTEPVFQYFKATNPQMSEPYGMKADTTDVLTFPMVAPDQAIVRADIDALTFLGYVKLVQENWVVPGTAHEKYAPGLRHNVSNTVTVKPEEWDQVADCIWENRALFTGVSLLGASGDKDYQQAPNEEVTTLADIRKWNQLKPKPVDFTKMVELTDGTDLQGAAGCQAGNCEII